MAEAPAKTQVGMSSVLAISLLRTLYTSWCSLILVFLRCSWCVQSIDVFTLMFKDNLYYPMPTTSTNSTLGLFITCTAKTDLLRVRDLEKWLPGELVTPAAGQ